MTANVPLGVGGKCPVTKGGLGLQQCTYLQQGVLAGLEEGASHIELHHRGALLQVHRGLVSHLYGQALAGPLADSLRRLKVRGLS